MNERIHTIAVTIGDPNGAGPEIAVKAAAGLRGNAVLRVITIRNVPPAAPGSIAAGAA